MPERINPIDRFLKDNSSAEKVTAELAKAALTQAIYACQFIALAEHIPEFNTIIEDTAQRYRLEHKDGADNLGKVGDIILEHVTEHLLLLRDREQIDMSDGKRDEFLDTLEEYLATKMHNVSPHR